MSYFSEIATRFSTYDDTSKVWLFKSPETFSERIEDQIMDDIRTFISNWNSHGKSNQANVEIIFHQFIVILVSEGNSPSGCSLDTLTEFIKLLESKYQINLMLNNLVYYISKEGEIRNIDFSELSSIVSEDTLILKPYFDNLKDMKENFFQEATSSVYANVLK